MCIESLYGSLLIALISGISGGFLTHWVMRSNQRHQYGQCLYAAKIPLFRELFSALNVFIKSLDSPKDDKILQQVKDNAWAMQYIVTNNSASCPRDTLSLCGGFAVAANRAASLDEIGNLFKEINLYKLLLMLGRRELSADKLSAATLKVLDEFAIYKKITISYPPKNIDKDVKYAIMTLQKFINDHR